MPERDGFELMRQIRDSGDHQVKIIAASASVIESDQAHCLGIGCDDFLAKPLEIDSLLAKLQQHLCLTWIYQQPAINAPAGDTNTALALIYPLAAKLATLNHLARIGDISGLQKEALKIRDLDPQYHAFFDCILALAREFDDRGLLNLLSISS